MKNLKIENVWEYPRPPICDPHVGEIKVIINNKTIAKSKNVIRVLETSHPPTYYIPVNDIKLDFLKKNKNNSFCEWKGFANYYDLIADEVNIPNVGWYYPKPTKNFFSIKNFISFYAVGKLKCVVNGEIVKKQDGNFYGGWITTNLRGPFKGGTGTMGW